MSQGTHNWSAESSSFLILYFLAIPGICRQKPFLSIF